MLAIGNSSFSFALRISDRSRPGALLEEGHEAFACIVRREAFGKPFTQERQRFGEVLALLRGEGTQAERDRDGALLGDLGGHRFDGVVELRLRNDTIGGARDRTLRGP